MGLKRYQSMRDFSQTPEPKGRKVSRSKAAHFVIQKHSARRLHYDFRLEMDGVLVSWAVPKGPPTARGDKRLAVHVEDHPLAYADFEGIIPAGNYGAGTVMVWDKGTYQVEGNPLQALKKGKLDIRLRGKKLTGDWTLVRTHHLEGKEPWLLIKRDRDMKPISKAADDRSAKTGRTMSQIARARDKFWQSNRQKEKKKLSPRPKRSLLPLKNSRKRKPALSSR